MCQRLVAGLLHNQQVFHDGGRCDAVVRSVFLYLRRAFPGQPGEFRDGDMAAGLQKAAPLPHASLEADMGDGALGPDQVESAESKGKRFH